jgi:hypothetical protein
VIVTLLVWYVVFGVRQGSCAVGAKVLGCCLHVLHVEAGAAARSRFGLHYCNQKCNSKQRHMHGLWSRGIRIWCAFFPVLCGPAQVLFGQQELYGILETQGWKLSLFSGCCVQHRMLQTWWQSLFMVNFNRRQTALAAVTGLVCSRNMMGVVYLGVPVTEWIP